MLSNHLILSSCQPDRDFECTTRPELITFRYGQVELKIPLAVHGHWEQGFTGVGFFQLTRKKWLLVSQLSQGEDTSLFTFYKEKVLGLHRPRGRGQESKRERAFQRESRSFPAIRPYRKHGASSEQPLLQAHPAIAASPPFGSQTSCFSFSHNNPPSSP